MDGVMVKFAGIAKEFFVTPVLDLGFTAVRWYGAIIAFGFLLAVLFGGRVAYVWKINLDKMIDVLLFGTVGAIVGARLYYVAFKWDYYSAHLSEIYKIWEGGLAIYGGIIGGLLCAFIVCKVEKINVPNLLDMVGMSLLIGQGIGRWGNYANQEAFGGNTDGSIGMMSEKVTDYILRHQAELPGVDPYAPVHPTFFYESVWCLVGFLLLFLMCKKFRKFSGQIFLSYGIWYGIGRMIIEGLRTDSLYIGDTNLRVSQLLSAAIVIVCTAIMIAMIIKHMKNPKPVEGVDYFIEPVPFLKKNREKFEAEQKAKAQESEIISEEKQDVHKD